MGLIEVLVDLQIDRSNDNPAALGRLRRINCLNFTCIWSPDAVVYIVPSMLTMVLVFGVVFVLWAELGLWELCVLFLLLLAAFTSSFLVICTDPGVYPRLRPGELDPLHDEKELSYCRVCALRRPPRTSHCYQCGVCVKEHDHHCGIIGGCVGQRSLRWFVLYLVTVSSAASMGLFWIFRSLYTGAFALNNTGENPGKFLGANNKRLPSNLKPSAEDAVRSLIIVALFVVLLIVVIVVGGFSVFYMYLVLTSTTRRESQRKQTRFGTFFRPRLMWENLMHVLFPPPSLLRAMPERTVIQLL